MQKPAASARRAWCSPPAMLNARVARPLITCSAAVSVAPTMSAAASCMPATTGTSSEPSPKRWNEAECASGSDARFTMSMYSASCASSSSASVARRGATTAHDGSSSSARRSMSRTVSSSRCGFRGCSGLKR